MSIPKQTKLPGHSLVQRLKHPVLQPLSNAVQSRSVPSAAIVRPPIAPPVYRPQPTPKVLQRKINNQQSPAGPSKNMPIAPAVFRPQPMQKVLQTKSAGAMQQQPSTRSKQLPVPPPVYRPVQKKALQPKIDVLAHSRKTILAVPVNQERPVAPATLHTPPPARVAMQTTRQHGTMQLKPTAHNSTSIGQSRSIFHDKSLPPAAISRTGAAQKYPLARTIIQRAAPAPSSDKVISGHGAFNEEYLEVVNRREKSATFTVPQGVTVVMYAPDGVLVEESVANRVELGNYPSAADVVLKVNGGSSEKPVPTPYPRRFTQGQSVVNYTVSPPKGLNVQGGAYTVTAKTSLKQIVEHLAGQGHTVIHYACCGSGMSDKRAFSGLFEDGRGWYITLK